MISYASMSTTSSRLQFPIQFGLIKFSAHYGSYFSASLQKIFDRMPNIVTCSMSGSTIFFLNFFAIIVTFFLDSVKLLGNSLMLSQLPSNFLRWDQRSHLFGLVFPEN